MYRFKGVVVAFVHRHDALGMGAQFLDIHPGTEAPAFSTDDQHMHVVALTQGTNFRCDCCPFTAVKGIHGWLVEYQVTHTGVDLAAKGCHSVCPPGCSLARWLASRSSVASASDMMSAIRAATVGRSSIKPAT